MNSRTKFVFSVIFLSGLLLSITGTRSMAQPPYTAQISSGDMQANTQIAAVKSLNSTPVMFIENVGQFDERARFLVHGGDRAMWLTDDGLWITILECPQNDSTRRDPLSLKPFHNLQAKDNSTCQGVHLKLSFVGANPNLVLEPFAQVDTMISYFLGDNPTQWRVDVPIWTAVRYRELYPGVDLEITSEGGRVVQRLATQPGADLSTVRLGVEGAEGVVMDSETLLLQTTVGEYRLPLFEVEGGNGEPVLYNVGGNAYEVARPFIQPGDYSQSPIPNLQSPTSDLLYATFLGGSDYDVGRGLAVDGAGSAYVTGGTTSSDFPTTPGTFDGTFNGYYDAFVVKVDSEGSGLVYATFLGGSSSDSVGGIAVDETGNAYVTGSTSSSDFPTTPGAYDNTHNGSEDAFVAKVNPEGSGLVYATFLGGSSSDSVGGIAVDETGNAYVTGSTISSDFPTTPGAYDITNNGIYDAFLVKVMPSGSSLAYATYLGGSYWDLGYGIAVDETGNSYITGSTESSNFPTTPGAFDETWNGVPPTLVDAFVVKVNLTGSGLVYATFLGGTGQDQGDKIVVDWAERAYVAGVTGSSDFPSTPGAFDETLNGELDVFVVNINPTGSELAFSTLLGGIDDDWGNGIAVDETGDTYVTGNTSSSDFPHTQGAFDETHNGSEDAFVVKVNSTGTNLNYATFLGGIGGDEGNAIAVDLEGNAYVTGNTSSSNFPTTPGAFDETYNGDNDTFVVKMTMEGGDSGYSISGQVTDSNNQPISGVTVSTSSNSATTDTNGIFTITGLITGTYSVTPYKSGYTFSPSSRTITVPPDAEGVDFVGMAIPSENKPIVVLVHGWQPPLSTAKVLNCSPFTPEEDVVDYSITGNTTTATQYWGEDFLNWLEENYDVWVAQLSTGKNGTPSLDFNSWCLANQISYVYEETGQQGNEITIVAHSMGGLVSRACLSMPACKNKVQTLVTLGSPHAGIPYNGLIAKFRIDCRFDLGNKWRGVCDMSNDNMRQQFNRNYPNVIGIEYYFIGGDGSTRTTGFLQENKKFWEKYNSGPNDALIGKYSAVGWGWDIEAPDPEWWTQLTAPQQYWTDEYHSAFYSHVLGIQVSDDYYHYRIDNPSERSHAYQCFTPLLQGQTPPSNKCQDVNTLVLTHTPQSTTPTQITQFYKDNLSLGQTLSPTLQIDTTDETIFYLSWYTGTLDFRLKSPIGQIIDPAYAASNPDEVAYSFGLGGPEAPPFASYSITNTLPGEWTLIVDASNLGTANTDYWTFGLLETDRTLDTGIDGYFYNAGDTAVLTATLQSGGVGIAGVNVTAEIARSDGVTDTLTLIDQGEGNYAANYTIPNAPGYLNISIVAIGNNNGTDFTRQSDLLAVIAPQDAQFTGMYSDQGNDDNGDSFYEYLDFAAEVDVANAGDYIVSALLLSEDGQLVTNIAVDISLIAGTQNVVLPFDGDDIRAAKIDGPYTIANLQITEITSGIPSEIVDEAWTTGYYNWEDFGSSPPDIYLPIVVR